MKEIDSYNSGIAAEFIVAGIMIRQGWDMLLPFNRRSKYDLAGFKDGKLIRFQVKQAGWVNPYHTSAKYLRVALKTKKYSSDDFEYYLILCPQNRLWMIPMIDVFGKTTVTLDKTVENNRTWKTNDYFEASHYLIQE